MPTTYPPTRMNEPCLKGCRSVLLEHDSDPALTPQDHHAYTCARCRGTVCAMCGQTPVRWAGYICRRCTVPTPAPLTAKQLRAVLEDLADDQVVTFHGGGRIWSVSAASGRNTPMALIAT
ncbi:hypothetical protein ACWFMI_27225 [Nocardiopsis terrae]